MTVSRLIPAVALLGWTMAVPVAAAQTGGADATAEPPGRTRSNAKALSAFIDIVTGGKGVRGGDKDKPKGDGGAGEREVLAQTVRALIEPCWEIPEAVPGVEQLVVDIELWIEPDGTLLDARFADQKRVEADADYRTVALSAMQAVSTCTPLKGLPPDKYEMWKIMKLTFDPALAAAAKAVTRVPAADPPSADTPPADPPATDSPAAGR